MIFKEYIGSTPKYKASMRDEDNVVIDPSSTFIKVIIKIYNIDSGDLLIGYTSENPKPAHLSSYYNCVLSSTLIKWAIPSKVTLLAESGEYRLEIWTYKTDAGIPDESVEIECYSVTLNEFIDAQLSQTTTVAPTTTTAPTTT